MPELPLPVEMGTVCDSVMRRLTCYGFTRDHMIAYAQAYGDARAAAERERCAKVCESFIDGREQARATLAAAKALNEGTEREMIDRLSHESTVHLFNRTLERCAAAIRATTQGDQP